VLVNYTIFGQAIIVCELQRIDVVRWANRSNAGAVVGIDLRIEQDRNLKVSEGMLDDHLLKSITLKGEKLRKVMTSSQLQLA